MQYPLQSTKNMVHDASRAFPDTPVDQEFILTPALTLPSSFGTTYVGECFTCSLCANNELPDGAAKIISHVQLSVDIQTPSQTVTLLDPSTEGEEPAPELRSGATQQRVIRFDLKEEGSHTLIVSLTYTESSLGAAGRVRTFRKLYQFEAQACLNVRTKATELQSDRHPLRYTLEAQIENVSASALNILRADLLPGALLEAKSLNWDVTGPEDAQREPPFLRPRDIYQLAFLVEQASAHPEGLKDMKKHDRVVLGQIALEWTGAMGQKGQLTTGNLTSRKR